MRKGLPLSALITGLLAGPALGAAPFLEQRAPAAEVVVETFPAVMPAEVEEEMLRLQRGEALSAHGMQGLRRRLALQVQERLARLAPARPEALVPVQLVQLNGGNGATIGLIAPAAPRKEKAAFLGVATSSASATLRSQLNINRGMGLVVDLVEKDSPAEAAGVKVHDILQKFDDQLLVNAQQLAVLVRSRKPGDEIKLTLLREGKPVTVSAKLVEKEVAVLEEMEEPRLSASAGALPEGISPEQLLQNLPTRNTTGDWTTLGGDGSFSRRLVDDQNDITLSRDKDGKETLAVKDRQGHTIYEGTAEKADLEPDVMKKIHTLQHPQPAVRADPGATMRSISATRVDDKYQITITSDGRASHVVAKDLAGNKVFEGSADGDADFKAMPADVAEKVKGMLEKMK